MTGPDGAFAFPDLLPGTFDLTVKVQSFKSYEQKGIVVGVTGVQTDANFGKLTGATLSARRIQLGVRFTF